MLLDSNDQLDITLLNGAVDADFYCSVYDDVAVSGVEPAIHYKDTGWREGRDPSPWFSTAAYLEDYPDVRASGNNPLLHFLANGYSEGRIARPSEYARIFRSQKPAGTPVQQTSTIIRDASGPSYRLDAVNHVEHRDNPPCASPDAAPAPVAADGSGMERGEVGAIAHALDEVYYLQQIAAAGMELGAQTAAEHYVSVGTACNLDPTDWFSTRHYIDNNPDVAAAGVNPFYHYLVSGKSEGRSPIFSDDENLHEREVIEPEFDCDYYLGMNPDVEAAGIDPLVHFLKAGWREGRDPNPFFSTRDYLETYGDIADAGINPFYHYVVAGRKEGRKPKANLGFRYDIISKSTAFETEVGEQRAGAPPIEAGGRRRLSLALTTLTRCANRLLYVSISHDNYTENFGGVQLCLRREAEEVAKKSYDHVHLFPASPLLVVDDATLDPTLGVVLNGQTVGFFKSSTIADALRTIFGTPDRSAATVHSLLGHNVRAVGLILRAIRAQRVFFWVHDYAAICTNFNLLRNDVQFCGAPKIGSASCRVCRYGDSRLKQFELHKDLLKSFPVTVIAPSQTAMDMWKETFAEYTVEGRILRHCDLVARRATDGKWLDRTYGRAAPVRVAFLGIPNGHKGWPVFRELALEFGKDKRYEFYHLGTSNQRGLPLAFREVIVSETQNNAMAEAILDCRIDVALIWSLWPETFCFTAYEAVAGGARVITTRDSGNVTTVARKYGAIYENETQLTEAFASGAIVDLVRAQRRTIFDIRYSGMTAEFLD